MMKHVDLCSGIGGFALGFQWAGLSKPVLFCDIEPWSRRVLKKHWPDVPIAEDVKELAVDPERLVPECDILTAGYPCQPFSVAGQRRGAEDDRHIWPQIRTIVESKRPRWAVFENVYGHISMGLDAVLSDLEAIGYSTRAFVVPASAVDAPHQRYRTWIIGYRASDRGQSMEYPNSFRSHEHKKSEEEINRRTETFVATTSTHVADTGSSRLQGRAQTRNDKKNQAQPDDKQFTRRSGAHKLGKGRPTLWKPEPDVGRVAHGIPRRVDRIKGLGNAIVPQIAQQIGEVILAIETR